MKSNTQLKRIKKSAIIIKFNGSEETEWKDCHKKIEALKINADKDKVNDEYMITIFLKTNDKSLVIQEATKIRDLIHRELVIMGFTGNEVDWKLNITKGFEP